MPQGSVWGHYFFYYINNKPDLYNNSNVVISADDTTTYIMIFVIVIMSSKIMNFFLDLLIGLQTSVDHHNEGLMCICSHWEKIELHNDTNKH